jgi:hypothetical protein
MSEASRWTESVTHTVITAVAQYEGVDPASLTPPLFDVVDPDALDALCTDTHGCDTPVQCTFTYRSHRIVVDSDGFVEVSDGATEVGTVEGTDTVES